MSSPPYDATIPGSEMSRATLVLAAVVAVLAVATVAVAVAPRKAPRVNLPLLGIGVRCNGCPLRSCEDDPAVVYGYCCGCAKLLDKLPVLCPRGLRCPLNGAGLCHDYEYMMRCCC